MHVKYQRFRTLAGQDLALLARIRYPDGELANPNNTHMLDIAVSNQNGDLTYERALNLSCLFDDLQTGDPRWEPTNDVPDGLQGYNFAYVCPAIAFPARGWYQIHVTLTSTTGIVTISAWDGAAGT
jgi:hypothetical protein